MPPAPPSPIAWTSRADLLQFAIWFREGRGTRVSKAANDDAAGLFRLFGEEDIEAYARGGLSPERRRQIEGYLACNPDLAARVMGALHRNRAPSDPRRGRRGPSAAMLACGLAVVCGVSAWAGARFDGDGETAPGWREADGDRAPGYVQDAVMSRRVVLVREAMRSQPQTPTLDAEEISRALKLRLPRLPQAWRVLDVQVFPSDDGPGVSLSAATSEGERLTLFAVRADAPTVDGPVIASRGDEHVAYWESDGTAFVLSGEGPDQALLDAAKGLAAS